MLEDEVEGYIYPFSHYPVSVNEDPVEWIDTIIIHIHGGGFVSLNSYAHQTYLRKWTKLTKFPVFSIDYTNAPEKQFPE